MKKKQYNQVAGCLNYIFRSNVCQHADIDSPHKWHVFRVIYQISGGQPDPDSPSSNETDDETRLSVLLRLPRARTARDGKQVTVHSPPLRRQSPVLRLAHRTI